MKVFLPVLLVALLGVEQGEMPWGPCLWVAVLSSWIPSTPLSRVVSTHPSSLSLCDLFCATWEAPLPLQAIPPASCPYTLHLDIFCSLSPSSTAHSLVCFSCTNQNSNFYCLKPTICSDSDNYCVTISAAAGVGECWPGSQASPHPILSLLPLHSPSFSGAGNIVDLGHSLNKGCSPVCPAPPSINIGVASMGTHCCQSFLCNISAADGGLRASTTVLGLGLLLSLLSALLRLCP